MVTWAQTCSKGSSNGGDLCGWQMNDPHRSEFRTLREVTAPPGAQCSPEGMWEVVRDPERLKTALPALQMEEGAASQGLRAPLGTGTGAQACAWTAAQWSPSFGASFQQPGGSEPVNALLASQTLAEPCGSQSVAGGAVLRCGSSRAPALRLPFLETWAGGSLRPRVFLPVFCITEWEPLRQHGTVKGGRRRGGRREASCARMGRTGCVVLGAQWVIRWPAKGHKGEAAGPARTWVWTSGLGGQGRSILLSAAGWPQGLVLCPW